MIETCFEMLYPQNIKNYDAIQMVNSSIFEIVLKLNQLIPQFHFTIKIYELGALHSIHIKFEKSNGLKVSLCLLSL